MRPLVHRGCFIRATRGSKVLAYSVYLGENNTSDFNVRPTAITGSI